MLKNLAVAALLAATPLLSHATLITKGGCGHDGQQHCSASWSDQYSNPTLINKNDNSTLNDSLSWSFDLTKDGFLPTVDSVYNYSLNLNFSDDKECIISGRKGCKTYSYDLQQEWTKVVTGGTTAKFEVDPSLFGKTFKGTASGIAELNSTGELKVSILGISGDFYFLDGILEACGIKGDRTSVPEPSSIALLAAGLLGIAAMRRKNA